MNLKGEITKETMYEGVRNSEAMILFLTNSYLSRPFCLLELEWAIDMQKPILILVEREERFWCWDIERWRTNRCTRDSNNKWVEGWLSRKYEDCSEKVRTFIEYQHDNGLMLEYRRRDFEISALTREITLRIRRTGRVPWGGTFPLDRELSTARDIVHPSVYVLHDTTKQVVRVMAREFESMMSRVLPNSRVEKDWRTASDVVILLTRHLLENDSKSLREMIAVTSKKKASSLTFVYLNTGDESWDWSSPSRVKIDDENEKSKFQASICGREAYIWRGADVPHEHYALVRDIVLKRFLRHAEDELEKEMNRVSVHDGAAKGKVRMGTLSGITEESEDENEYESSSSSSEEESESEESGSEENTDESSSVSSEYESESEESKDEGSSSGSEYESESEEDTESKEIKAESKRPLRVVKKKVKVRVPSKFLEHCKKGQVKKNYKVRVPSNLLKQTATSKKKIKVRVPSKFFKSITERKAVTSKKKLKVRVPSTLLKRAVKKQVVLKKKMKIESSSALTKLQRFVRAKRGVKVHPIVGAADGE